MKKLVFILLCVPIISVAQTNWQQQADYFMDIEMDVSDFTFKGNQKIIYTNNSPDTINKVYYHLFFNAFKPGSQMDVRSRTIQDPDRRVGDRIFGLKEKDFGDLSVKTLKQDGKKVEFKEFETVLLVKLNTVLLPGEKTELKILLPARFLYK